MSVAIVTPWLEHSELADDYFEAINAGNPDEVIVVDNGSFPPLVFATIRLETNTGFTHGSNVGLHAATADKVVFLNNDIVMTEDDWLERLTDAIDPGVLAGARLRSDEHTRIQGISNRLPYLDGWCLGGMRDDLLALGGFDETFDEPAYYSDNDLCLRARCSGMRLREAHVGLYHKVAVTSGWSAGGNPRTQAVVVANYKRYAQRARELLSAATAGAGVASVA